MRRVSLSVRVLLVIGLAVGVGRVSHPALPVVGQAAGVGGVQVVSVVPDDPGDPAYQAPYTYLVDAGDLAGVTPSARLSETYQLYDDSTGDILDSSPVGPDGSVVLTFAAQDRVSDLHVINISDPGDGSAVVTVDSVVTVVVNQAAGAAPPYDPGLPDIPGAAATVPQSSLPTGPAVTSTVAPQGSRTAIYMGDCGGNFDGDPVAELIDVAAPQGDPQGAAAAVTVETSYSRVPMSLTDLVAEDQVLVVFDEDDDTVPLACGAIGGVIADGELSFGLQPIDGSGWSGVVYLGDDGFETRATVYLAKDLSAEASPTA